MIVLTVISLLVVAGRLYRRQMTRGELALVMIVAANFLLVWIQEIFGGGKPFPEARYYMQSGILLFGFGIWRILMLPPLVVRGRALPAKRLLGLVLVLFAAYALVLLCKAHFPLGRRAAYVAACDWARDRIAADWKGPKADAVNVYDNHEYHSPRRPIVQAHTARLPYLLGGRDTAPEDFPEVDIPDYWFSDIRRDDPPSSGYEKIDAFRHGKYEFHLYRRKTAAGGAR